MGLARHSHSPLLYECSGLLWMLLLPLALTGSAVSGEKLLRSAAPRVPRSIAALIPLLPGTVAALVWPDDLLGALGWALPWRALLSAAAGERSGRCQPEGKEGACRMKRVWLLCLILAAAPLLGACSYASLEREVYPICLSVDLDEKGRYQVGVQAPQSSTESGAAAYDVADRHRRQLCRRKRV